MSNRLKTAVDQRLRLITDLREIRGDDAEARQKYERLFAEQDRLRTVIDLELKSLDFDPEAAEAEMRRAVYGSKAYRRAFARFLMTGEEGKRGLAQCRALTLGMDTGGGFLVPSETFLERLIKTMDNQVQLRRFATVITAGIGERVGAPALTVDPDDADFVSELEPGSEDSAIEFGKRALSTRAIAKRVKIGKDLLRRSALAERTVADRLGYKFAVTGEQKYLTGSGAGQPLGVFTGSNDGIPTSQDVSTGNTTTSIAFDNLLECKFTLKAQYHANARWLYHRDGVKQIAKLKDGSGQYLWQPATAPGQPDMIAGFPAMLSEYAPNTFTTGLYVGILGDFSHYWITESVPIIQHLIELYAEAGQDGFIGRQGIDGMPTIGEAFVRVKLA